MAADDALSVFRSLDRLALAAHRRTGLWTEPLRLARFAAEIVGEAPPHTQGALEAIFRGAPKLARKADAGAAPLVRVPLWLMRGVQNHLTEFCHLYALSRGRSNLYCLGRLRAMDHRWPALALAMRNAGVHGDVIEQIERFMATRSNYLLASGNWPDFHVNMRLVDLTHQGDSMARKLSDATREYATGELRKRGLRLARIGDLPFGELDAFGKLHRLLPENDPAWREIGAWAAARAASGGAINPQELQGLIGELVALRVPGVMAFIRDETSKVLAANPELIKQGWRVVFQPRSVWMAKRSKAFEKAGGKLAGEGLNGAGLSFDTSVWLVKDEAAMSVLRLQVKAGTEATVLKGVDQSLVGDEWRAFSDTVELEIDGVTKRFENRPPDTFNVTRVLVGAGITDPAALIARMPPATRLDVFSMPLSGADFGKIGGALAEKLKRR